MDGSIVLLVDDDGELLEVLELALDMINCRVARAESGAAALRILRRAAEEGKGWPSLALLDLMLPDMKGEEVYQQVRALSGPPLPVIVMSATVDVATRSERLGLPYLAKPFNIDDLVALVQRHCPSATSL